MRRAILIITTVLVLGVVFVSSAAAQGLNPEPYRIQPGDTLSSIAQDFCTTWQDVYRYNAGYIGDDPNALRVGTLIYVIDRCDQNDVYDRGPRQHAMGTVNGQYYTVVAGDTLYSISQRFGLNYQIIMEANGLDSTSVVRPGTQLLIPGLNVGHIPPLVTINYPADGSAYYTPYVVTGTGQGLHEGNVVVRLLDANGNLIAEQATALQGPNVATGGFGTYRVQFNNIYTRPQSNGSVEAFSPETGATAVSYFLFSGW
jgi:LysM repeat protein